MFATISNLNLTLLAVPTAVALRCNIPVSCLTGTLVDDIPKGLGNSEATLSRLLGQRGQLHFTPRLTRHKL